jgi:hypothetical protein
MLSTIIVAAIFLGLVILQVILWAMFLRLGLRWATVPDVTTRKVVLATGAALVGSNDPIRLSRVEAIPL